MAFYLPENTCQFMGRLGKEPKDIGKDRLAFSIAVRNPSDKDNAIWPGFFVGGPSADYMRKYVSVGDFLVVTAQYRTWKNKDDSYGHGFDVVSLSKVGNPPKEDRGDRQDKQERKPSRRDDEDDMPQSNRGGSRRSREDDNDTNIPF